MYYVQVIVCWAIVFLWLYIPILNVEAGGENLLLNSLPYIWNIVYYINTLGKISNGRVKPNDILRLQALEILFFFSDLGRRTWNFTILIMPAIIICKQIQFIPFSFNIVFFHSFIPFWTMYQYHGDANTMCMSL